MDNFYVKYQLINELIIFKITLKLHCFNENILSYFEN